MDKPDRRERQKLELRTAILDAAERLIVASGFSTLTMRRLADEVEYSAASMYQHFDSRDELAKALVKRGFGRLLDEFAPAMAIADPRERLYVMSHAYIEFALRHPQTYRLIFMESADFTAAAFTQVSGDDENERAFGVLVSTVVELQVQGALRETDDAKLLATLIWNALHGIVSLHITDCRFVDMPAAQIGDHMLTALLAGLAPAAKSGSERHRPSHVAATARAK